MPDSAPRPAGTASGRGPLSRSPRPVQNFSFLLGSLLHPGGVRRVEGRMGIGTSGHRTPIQECLVIPKNRSLGGEGEPL